MQAFSIKIDHPGGTEAMIYREAALSEPGAGEVLLRQNAVGLNFIDVYHRTGLYPVPLPSGLGLEAAGVIEVCGPEVTSRYGLNCGDRVAYGTGPIGSYASARVMPASRLVKIPDEISDEVAAVMMLKGMTVRYLLRKTYPVAAGETILFHAAAGGVGLIACQWAKMLGATIIGTVGSEEKAELARAHGCDHVINIREEDVVVRVRELTDGRGVPVVYDSIGRDTLMTSFDCLCPRGMMVSFGNASGPTGAFDPLILSQKGSLFFTRPSLMHHVAEDADFRETVADLMSVVASGRVVFAVRGRYALADAAKAHEDLEARRTMGASVLIPS